MDQELKQRLIGAAVITALAAIFVPMLFDDPIDESGKTINELTIPELPSKAQDVEIMPLPEKVDDVVTVAPPAKPKLGAPVTGFEGEEDVDMTRRPRAVIAEEDVAVRTKPIEPEQDAAYEEDVSHPSEVIAPVKPGNMEPSTVDSSKAARPAESDTISKPSVAAQNATIRWYLNAGSFSKKENAIAMQESLKKQGFAVSIKEVASDKGPIFRVRVGPMLDKAKAQEVKSKLTQINVKSFVSGDD